MDDFPGFFFLEGFPIDTHGWTRDTGLSFRTFFRQRIEHIAWDKKSLLMCGSLEFVDDID